MRLIQHITDWLASNGAGPYNHKLRDAVFPFAGTGSVGVKRYLLLLKSTSAKGRYLLLDMKQSFGSSLANVVGKIQPKWENNAERIASIQQRMQYVSAANLDTTDFDGDSYVLGEMQPMEDTFDFSMISGNYRSLIQVIDDMGMLIVSAQLPQRWDGRLGQH